MATISFSGQITMAKGKVGEISDQTLADDLLKAGYVIPYESTEKKVEKKEAKPKKKKEKGETV
jgi:hypothetical protein